jgi:hypothetical protein
VVRSQCGQTVLETLSRKTLHKNGASGVAQVKALSSSPNTAKKEAKGLPLKTLYF